MEYFCFYAYLIMAVFGLVISVIDLSRAKYETVGPVLILISFIGLACNYAGWARTFSGIYGIVWSG